MNGSHPLHKSPALLVRSTRRRMREAFTLVELLMVIAIIGILASATLFSLMSVQQDAKERRTRAVIQKINDAIMTKWEQYRTRPVPIRIPPGTDPRTAAAIRLSALRELMKLELPDRQSDLFPTEFRSNPTPSSFDPYDANYVAPQFLNAYPSLSRAYRRRVDANGGLASWSPRHSRSECLYMILASLRDTDAGVLDFFTDKEIGDTDRDGMPEILDAWGRPIYFLRWAPGFESTLQDPANRQPDPFDPLRVDPRWENNDPTDPTTELDDPFALYPLIYSGGRNQRYGVVRDDYDPNTNPVQDRPIVYRDTNLEPYNSATRPSPWPPNPWPTTIWATRPANDPYVVLPVSSDFIGRRFLSGDGDDDLHNHLIEVR